MVKNFQTPSAKIDRKTRMNSSGKKKSSRFLFWLAFFSFAGVMIYVFFFSPYLAISSLDIIGGEKSGNDLREKIEKKISGRYFRFLQKNNMILISGKKLEKEMLERFKIISSIEISRDFPDKLTINVKERVPKLILCGKDICYVVDSEGEIFDQMNDENIRLFDDLPILRDEGGKEFDLHDRPLPISHIQYVADFMKKIERDLGLVLDKNVTTPKLVSGDIRFKTSENWNIYANIDIPLEKEMGMLKVVLENNIDRSRRHLLDYIDLRTNNKVYFKYKN